MLKPGIWIKALSPALETNHLGAALLALGLLPSLRRTAARASDDQLPRVVIVASDVHYWAELLAAKEEGNIIKAMNNEKLANKLSQSNVTEDKKIVVSSCIPGLCMSPEDAANPIIHFPRHSEQLLEIILKAARPMCLQLLTPAQRTWKDTLEVLGVTEQDFQL
ncbi:unnamed protein product [Umbelopsis sp. WA50703]